MGCDIHMFIEYRCGNGMPWHADDHHASEWEDRCRDKYPKNPSSWCDQCKSTRPDEQTKCWNGYKQFHQVSAVSRNYQLFGLLAGVRTPGPDPLGIPSDISQEVLEALEWYGSDFHSHSYISLEDFKDVLFNKMNFKPSDSNDAFYDWRNIPWDKRPPSYTTIVNYCDKLKETKSLDKQLLGENTTSEVQIRLVFCFDN